MTGESDRMILRRIGTVHSKLMQRPDARDEALRKLPARIEVLPAYHEALDGLSAGDEILVLFWLDRMRDDERSVMKVHPRGDAERPLTGVFATRSPARPNPIGATKVRVLSRENSTLVVEGLDALDGTPVVDIKIQV